MSGLTYEAVSTAVQQGGTLYFMLIFLAGCAYAFLPHKKAEFDEAARAPLEEDE